MIHLYLTLNLLRTAAHCVVPTRAGVHEADQSADAGLSTLEVVVIALGLFLVAGVLVAAITAAVNSRISQIN